ncbi:MAG: glycerol kinase GlpK, partial [Anaerotardibacter sp.]
MKKYIVALDQGTTSSRAVLINHNAEICGVAQSEFPQHFPQPGWVEHDPKDILSSQLKVLAEVLVQQGLSVEDIDSVGITNQRETTIVSNKETGEPIYNAIVWQCRRTADLIEEVCSTEEVRQTIIEKTGLIPDAYFSASKISWILRNVEGAQELADQGLLLFGTVDTWLIWHLTGGKVHATDPTNASRTMLFNIHEGTWDPWLCQLFGVPQSMLPEVRPSSSNFGMMEHPVFAGEVPICGVAGDQQAALFGQCCFEPGEAKSTFGTGCFLLMHTGQKAVSSSHGLVTTVAASAPGTQGLEYALEGSVFMAGALLQWLVDGIGLVSCVEETEALAQSVDDNAGVYVVPAFTGLGAPYWDSEARGAFYGLTRGTTKAHLVRACLEAQAYQVFDVLHAMEEDAAIKIKNLCVDGGASRNNFMLDFCADIINADILRPSNIEATVTGAAFLAGLCSGFWESTEEIKRQKTIERTFSPDISPEKRAAYLAGWAEGISRTRTH